MPVSAQRLEKLLGDFASKKILVVGDLMLDEFIWGKVARISPEAPVPVVEVQRSSFYPGGAANVVRNLCSFLKSPGVAGVIGKDEAGDKLLAELKKEGAKVEAVLQSPRRPTTLKTRIIARQQQVVRVDRERRQPLDAKDRQWLLDHLKEEIKGYDAVIIEDYGKGLVDQELASLVIAQGKTHGKKVAIDPNPNNLINWSGATAIKPNRQEAFLSAGLPPMDGEDDLLKAAQILLKKWDVEHLLITLGEEGMLLVERGQKPYHTPTRAQEVFDVSGAGDTAIAVFTLALAAGATGVEAAEIANHAAGVVVGKLGTATLTLSELRKSFNNHST
jgi:rfaE bifunctional protein kinase chain/domain